MAANEAEQSSWLREQRLTAYSRFIAVTERLAERAEAVDRRNHLDENEMLEQTHYDASARPILFSKTYFLEGRFEFSILRTR